MIPFNGRYLLFLICFSTFPAWSDESSRAGYSRVLARTSFEAIKNHLETLDTRGIESGSYSLLSIDGKYNQLLVGAKDNTFLVDLENIRNFQSWNLPTESSSNSACGEKQKGPRHNFVKIMVPFNERIFLCWASKETSGCAWRNRTNLRDVPGSDTKGNVFKSDVDYCSSPDQNDTAIITEHGTIFTGTKHPYYGNPMIQSRSLRPGSEEIFTSGTDQSDFYTDVQFVKSFDVGHYIYFFFREHALECSSCGKLKISRVARICKGDYGGPLGLKKNFVTFQKAKLICSDGADFPLNFNELQDVWWDDQAKLFYTIFLSHPNGPPSSAICMYNLFDINQVFDESHFKSFATKDKKKWITVQNNHKEYFKDCKVNQKYIDQTSSESAPDGMMAARKMKLSVHKNLTHGPLMEDPVQPFSFDAQSKKVSRALFIKDGVRMTGIAVDKIGAHSVVYTSTDRGSVLKISRLAGVHQPCLLSESDIFPDDKKGVIKAMTIDTTRHVLYLGLDTALTKLSLEQCSSYDRHSSCTSAADPYCAWDDETNRCVSILSHGDLGKLKQDLSTCPNMAVEDIESSPWKNCLQRDGNLCRCQVRPCQSKQNSFCEGGYEFRLENCTGGEWDRWSDWGQCTVEGFQIRRRQCKAEPCVGEKLQERKCEPTISEICKGDGDESLGDWAEWSACECKHELDLPEGSGVRSRIPKCRRECPNVSSCPDTVQYETCICESVVKMQPTPEINEGAEMKVGLVIAAAVAVFVLTIMIFSWAMYHVMIKNRNKKFDVSKAEEARPQNTSSRKSKHSTIPKRNGVPNRGPPPKCKSHSVAVKDSTKVARLSKNRKSCDPRLSLRPKAFPGKG